MGIIEPRAAAGIAGGRRSALGKGKRGTVSVSQDFGRLPRPLRRQTTSIRRRRQPNPPGDTLGCVLASIPGA